MTSVSTTLQSRNYLPLTISMMTCLILLINVSFKIVNLHGILFTTSSVLCPLIACLYLLVLRDCTLIQQRHILNQSLVALYLFSIGIYLLVNLPAAEHVRDNIAYQIVFDNIPRKFFASTIAFAVSFYLPHFYLCAKKRHLLKSPKFCLAFALFGGLCFFSLDFWLLFSDPNAQDLNCIYIDSLMVSTSLLLFSGLCYLVFFSQEHYRKNLTPRVIAKYFLSPEYHYLAGFSVTILLICLACEYRLVAITNGWVLAASSLLFPLILVACTLTSELYGYKASLRLTAILILSELVFDLLLMIAVFLPSPDFYNLNPFYFFIMPRRIPAATLALFLALGSNSFLLEKLKSTVYGCHPALRIVVANMLANSLLCLVNFTILYSGVFPYEQIFTLALSSWTYKLILTVASLPVVLWLSKVLKPSEPLSG